MISRYQIDTNIYDIGISNTMQVSKMIGWISLSIVPPYMVRKVANWQEGRISANILSNQGVEK